MQLLACCEDCGAPQGIFSEYEEIKSHITNQRICWGCQKTFISAIPDEIKNLHYEEFLDSEVLIEKSMEFWTDAWQNKYKNWLNKHEVNISDRDYKTHYELISNTIKDKFEKSQLWLGIGENLEEFNSEYNIINGYDLLLTFSSPQLYVKSFESFFLKTFRKNILTDLNQFNKPINGWLFPNNWYSKINDIVRTLFVVKYLDGVNFLVDKIESTCKEYDIKYQTSFEAKNEGYYAAHISILQEFEIPKYDWDTTKIPIWIEIQITTSLQDNIRKLLHKHYEENRVRIVKEDVKWQWNYKSNEFATNYIGHVLHYVEGMIMEIRDKKVGK